MAPCTSGEFASLGACATEITPVPPPPPNPTQPKLGIAHNTVVAVDKIKGTMKVDIFSVVGLRHQCSTLASEAFSYFDDEGADLIKAV